MPGEDGETGAGPGKRLIITHMTLENFKSYAGVQHIGPFHKRFSSVVGPNGSGKSNVIDAMLFVFGKKAKQLRLNKVSELIHKSENNMDLTSCKVSVHFVEILDKDVDGEDYEVIPGTELKVCRVATSDNQSLYYVNDKSSKFTEVAQLLTSKGIDLDHNRFLILQGEVELISLMPPKAKTEHETGMLEYLEDIIGSNRLVEAIEKTGKEVDTINEERGQKVTKLKIVEKDRDDLEGAKAEAEEYVRQQRSLLQREAIKCQLEKAKMLESAQGVMSEKAELDAQLESERAKLAAAKASVDEMSKSYEAEKTEYEVVQKELETTQEEFAVFERKDVKHKEDVKYLKAKEKKLIETSKKEKEKADKARDSVPKQEKAIKECEEIVTKMEKQIPREQEILDALNESAKQETKGYLEKYQAIQKELEPLAEKTREAQAAVDLVQDELKLITSRGTKAKDALALAKKKLADAEPAKKAKQSDVKSKQSAAAKVSKQIEDGKEELTTLKGKEQTLRTDIQSLRSKLEESKAASKSSKSQSAVAKALGDASRAGKIKGFYGRLGDLGTIDDKYDVAVTTACGALNHMLVETTETAQACCKILRDTGAGVATFIILEKQKDRKISDKSNFAAPRLFDLVKPKDSKYLPAFYFALRDTLVANDLEFATKLAYNGPRRNRVVTLEGAVIDISGTMSGGGNRVSKGGMSSKHADNDDKAMSEKELSTAEKSLAKQSDELTATRSKIQAMDKAVSQWEKELSDLEMTIKKLELELSAITKEQAEISANMSVYEEEAKAGVADKNKVKELEGALELNEKALAKAKAKSDVLAEKAKEAQQQISEAGGPKLKMQKTKVEGMQSALEEATANISKNKVGIKAAAKIMEKAVEAAANAEEEVVVVRENLEKTKAEFVHIEEAALKVMEAFKKAQEAQAEKQESLKKIEVEYEKVRKQASKLKNEQIELEERSSELNKSVKDLEIKAKVFDKEWEKLKSKYMDDEFILALDESEAAAEAEAASGEGEGEGEGDTDVAEKKEAKGPGSSIMRGFVLLDDELLAKHTLKDCTYNINLLKESIGRINPNMGAIAEYRTKEAEWRERQKELDEVTAKRDAMRAEHDTLRKQRLDEFMAGFSVITMRLKEMYQMITLGGDAELELVDSLDPFSEGIVFSVRPPKKSWKNISNLSGGEKTLSSLSLVFALHHYKPTPLYVMDEIDAALDFKNVSIVANYIKERTKNAQFIIISLRNNMFELADRLVGIYKTHHCTKSVTINPAKLAAHLPSSADTKPVAAA